MLSTTHTSARQVPSPGRSQRSRQAFARLFSHVACVRHASSLSGIALGANLRAVRVESAPALRTARKTHCLVPEILGDLSGRFVATGEFDFFFQQGSCCENFLWTACVTAAIFMHPRRDASTCFVSIPQQQSLASVLFSDGRLILEACLPVQAAAR